MNIDKQTLTQKAQAHLEVLCSRIGERPVGSAANRKATDYIEQILQEYGWPIQSTGLSVIGWHTDGASLTCNGQSFEVFSSQYSLGCRAVGEIVPIHTVAQLEETPIQDKIVLLYGNIASQQIAPKNFPFWNPEEHQHLVSLLEKGRPRALVCATERNAATAGGVYPFPLFEDGDFDIPSVYMKDTEGERLLALAGQTATLTSRAVRTAETACQVTALRPASASAERTGGERAQRVVVSAHVDSKNGTPGAIDNGTGVAVLLLLAQWLEGRSLRRPVELVFFNGEDYYGAPGQVRYIEQNEGRFDSVLLNINIDGVGYREGLTCFSGMELPEAQQAVLQQVIARMPCLVEGLPWYQGDHSVFLQQGCPALAVSSQWLIENMENQELTHTPKDNLSIVNYQRVAECALGVALFLEQLDAQ